MQNTLSQMELFVYFYSTFTCKSSYIKVKILLTLKLLSKILAVHSKCKVSKAEILIEQQSATCQQHFNVVVCQKGIILL